MPYIDTKYLFKCETCRHSVDGHGCTTFCDSGECYSPNMYKIPTADVVPRERFDRVFGNLKAVLEERAEDKAEVASEIFEEIEQEINAALQSNYKVLPQIEQSESLWNRVNGKIDALRGIDGFIAELKKKYTGGEQT